MNAGNAMLPASKAINTARSNVTRLAHPSQRRAAGHAQRMISAMPR